MLNFCGCAAQWQGKTILRRERERERINLDKTIIEIQSSLNHGDILFYYHRIITQSQFQCVFAGYKWSVLCYNQRIVMMMKYNDIFANKFRIDVILRTQ